jgi:YggT family protein
MPPFLFHFIELFLQGLQFLLFIFVIFSWFPGAKKGGFYSFLSEILVPLLSVFRKIPHIFAGIDFSPLYMFFAIDLLLLLLQQI